MVKKAAWPNQRYHTTICLEEIKETMTIQIKGKLNAYKHKHNNSFIE
jgi:hypothetical protein